MNLSGQRDGFIACDMLNEYVVREVKAMMAPNITPAGDEFLRCKLSLLLMTFKDLRKRMSESLQINNMDFHSSKVNPWKDIKLIVNQVLKGNIASMSVDRSTHNHIEVADLFTNGMVEISKGVGIEKLKARILDERSGGDDEVLEADYKEEEDREDWEDDDGEGDVFGGTDILHDPEWTN